MVMGNPAGRSKFSRTARMRVMAPSQLKRFKFCWSHVVDSLFVGNHHATSTAADPPKQIGVGVDEEEDPIEEEEDPVEEEEEDPVEEEEDPVEEEEEDPVEEEEDPVEEEEDSVEEEEEDPVEEEGHPVEEAQLRNDDSYGDDDLHPEDDYGDIYLDDSIIDGFDDDEKIQIPEESTGSNDAPNFVNPICCDDDEYYYYYEKEEEEVEDDEELLDDASSGPPKYPFQNHHQW